MSKPGRVLVTGLLGFTGRYVASELTAHGWEVWGVGAQSADQLPRYVQADLCDAEAVRQAVSRIQPEAVIHLAAIASVVHGNVEDFYRINLIGTLHLLSALAGLDAVPRCVLLASSANVYGNSREGELDEDSPPAPANDYAVSKLAMEHMALLWRDKLPLVVARPFNYTGVGQSENFLLPKIVAHFKRRASSIELGNLDVWRDFSDVRSVVQAYRRLLEVTSGPHIVNICSGVTHSLRDVIAIAQQITGHQIDVQVNPAFVRGNEVKVLSGKPERLRRLIGDWNSLPLTETMIWMLGDTSHE